MSKRRVVVTGMGIVSPVGNTLESAWDSIQNGVCGIDRISCFDASAFATQIAGEVKGFDPTHWIGPKDVKKMDKFIHYGFAASRMAMQDSGLAVTEANAERIGIVIGSGIGGVRGIEDTAIALHIGGPRKVSPFYVPSTIINMLPGQLSIHLGLKGPNFSAVSACASSNHSIGTAMRMIQYGDADVMIAGGAEHGCTPTAVGGFSSMKAMSTRNDDPKHASRPWDKDRDGFVLADGAGILVIEELEHAKARGARIYCELIGYGASSDAYHMTAPSENGEGPARCMRVALKDAGINPEQVDYVNAHGTSTPLGDLAETLSMKQALGEHAYKTMVSSTKSMTGHLLGAAGGVEAIFSVLALHHGVIPPTINLENPSEGCDLDYVPNVARQKQIQVAVSNGFGFGGTNATLVFRKL
ncbi:beta-ketoacyl-[acyl-carrier-protein] synthase II [Ahniella affigens]|uniref:3-oxoacyl-[acyl-carrier-protein] synthase 2 n=1 Tax=Ahniella affigens TaxID=2021234 RepID=A0A2P1PPA7_9GAMM|nr:beta-ketoacyl-ACP synthase II [Ahniella affigens]AVP96666.1 beta-ketoacyl-[acyl-carrier-protein] synthase II [Ahniella affigens]